MHENGVDHPPPAKKTRVRQMQSCSLCHQDKKACDKNIPCIRCTKRGLGESCHRVVVNRTLHPPQSLQPSQSAHPNQSSDVHGLNNRVKALEAALQAALSGDRGTVDKEAILRSVGVGDPVVQDEVGEAAMALGELAMSRGGQQFHGPGSVASFLASTFQPGSSAPRARSYLFFGEAATSVIQAFPPRAVCHHLKELFFSFHNMSLRFNVTPQVVFENLLRELLDYRDAVVLSPELALPLPNTLSFVGLASIYLATALQFLPASSEPFISQYYSSFRLLEEDLVAQSKVALSRSEENETADRYRVEATLFHGLYLKNQGRPSDNYHISSHAVRTAQALGMHRDGNYGLSPHETELRRRQWHVLFSYDKFSNFAFGRPYVIHDRHCDAKMPANVELDTLDPNSLDPIISLPLEEPTSYTASILEVQLAKIVGRITDRVFSAAPYTYRDVVECDAELLAYEEGLPSTFKMPPFELVQKCPSLPMQYHIITMQLMWIRMVLHRPYLLRPITKVQPELYGRSRGTAITLSQKLISAQRDLHVNLSISQKKFFLMSFQVFDPACTLAMAILQNPTLAESLDPWILEAHSVLSRMGPENVVATEGIRCLDALRRKFAEIIPPNVHLAPMAKEEASSSTVPVPYLGITASIGSSASMVLPHFANTSNISLPSLSNGSSSTESSTPGVTYSPSESLPHNWDDTGLLLAGEDSWPSLPSVSWPLGIGALDLVGGDVQWAALLKDMGISMDI